MSTDMIEINATAQGFKELYLQAKEFDKKLATNLRKNIRTAAWSVAGRVADNIRAVEQSANEQTGLSEAMAGGLKVLIGTGTNPSVRIRESASALPDGKQMLARKWERHKPWRHPVFADKGATGGSWRGAWAEGIRPQPVFPQLIASRPWFTWNMAEAMRQTAQQMADAVNSNQT